MDTLSPNPKYKFVLLALTAILLLGLHLRIIATFHTVVDRPIRADAADYLMYAYNLRHHQVYSNEKAGYNAPEATPKPDALRSPGYALFLTPFVERRMGPATLRQITLVQALIGVALIAAIYLLARQILPSLAALAVALLTAISPHLVNAGIYILSETWFALLLASGLVMTVVATRRRQRWPWLVAGLLLGAATLTRPGLQYFPLVLVPILWLSLECKRRLVKLSLLALGFTLVLAPWLIRNELVLGAMGDPTLKINFLHHGMYPGFLYQENPATYGFPYRFDPRAKEISQDVTSVLAEIRHRFAREPGRHLGWYLLGKPAQLWSWSIVQGMGDAFVYPVHKTPYASNPLFIFTRIGMKWIHLPIITLAAIGSVLAWLPAVFHALKPAARLGAQICSLLLLYYTAIHVIGAPFPRYAIPLLPIVYVMALFAIWQLWKLSFGRLSDTEQSLRQSLNGNPSQG